MILDFLKRKPKSNGVIKYLEDLKKNFELLDQRIEEEKTIREELYKRAVYLLGQKRTLERKLKTYEVKYGK